MKKLSKLIAGLLLGVSILALKPIGASAEFRQNSTGWWYHEMHNATDSWATGWREVNHRWYYFGEDGYMLHDTAVGIYSLGSDGAWLTPVSISSNVNYGSRNSRQTGVIFDINIFNLSVGDSKGLAASVITDDTTPNKLMWSSSDYSVATVDARGIIVAVKPGTATITCSTADGNEKAATCLVTVSYAQSEVTNTQNTIPAVILNMPSMTLNVGEKKSFPVPFVIDNPNDTSANHLIWSSSNTNVATVKAGGVTAVGVGTTTITCATEDGNERPDKCVVTVR